MRIPIHPKVPALYCYGMAEKHGLSILLDGDRQRAYLTDESQDFVNPPPLTEQDTGVSCFSNPSPDSAA